MTGGQRPPRDETLWGVKDQTWTRIPVNAKTSFIDRKEKKKKKRKKKCRLTRRVIAIHPSLRHVE